MQIAHLPFDGVLVEQRSGVIQAAYYLPFSFAQIERQIEFGRVIPAVEERHRHVAKVQIASTRPIPRQHRLEYRCVAQTPQRFDDLHHLLERQLLVVLGVQCDALHPIQQLRDATRYFHAQCLGVHKEADEVFEFRTSAVGDRRADHHIPLARQPRQHRRPRGQYRHIQRHAMTPAQRFQFVCERFTQRQLHPAASKRLLCRTWPVCRQFQQCRCADQHATPILALLLQHLIAQPPPLPQGIVGVLDGQWRQWIIAIFVMAGIQRDQFVDQ